MESLEDCMMGGTQPFMSKDHQMFMMSQDRRNSCNVFLQDSMSKVLGAYKNATELPDDWMTRDSAYNLMMKLTKLPLDQQKDLEKTLWQLLVNKDENTHVDIQDGKCGVHLVISSYLGNFFSSRPWYVTYIRTSLTLLSSQ
jgi:hypothetical protein